MRRKKKVRRPAALACDFLELFCCDAIVRMRDGVRRCLFVFIDPRSRFAFAAAGARNSSRHAAQTLRTLLFLLHRPMRRMLTDNGW